MKALTYTGFGLFYLFCFFVIVKQVSNPTYKAGLKQASEIMTHNMDNK